MENPIWPAESLVTIVKSDVTVYSPPIRQLYVGGTGDVSVVDQKTGSTIVFLGVPAGSYLGPFFVTQVKNATTATNMVGFI